MSLPTDPIRNEDKIVFGANVQRHAITGQCLETGIGAASVDRQAQIYCDELDRREGKTAGDAMRKRLADAKKFALDMEALKADGLSAAAAMATIH